MYNNFSKVFNKFELDIIAISNEIYETEELGICIGIRFNLSRFLQYGRKFDPRRAIKIALNIYT